MKNEPIEIQLALSELADSLARQAGLQVVQARFEEWPDKSIVRWLTPEGQASDECKVVLLTSVYEFQFITIAIWQEDAGYWDMLLSMLEYNAQAWPRNRDDAFSIPKDEDLLEAGRHITTEFLMRYGSYECLSAAFARVRAQAETP